MVKQFLLSLALLISTSFPFVAQAEPQTFFQKTKQAVKKYGLCALGAAGGAVAAVITNQQQQNCERRATSAQRWINEFENDNKQIQDAFHTLSQDTLLKKFDTIPLHVAKAIMVNVKRDTPNVLKSLLPESDTISIEDLQAFIARHKQTVKNYDFATTHRDILTRDGSTVPLKTNIYNYYLKHQNRWRAALVASVVVAAGSVAWAVYKARSKKEDALAR